MQHKMVTALLATTVSLPIGLSSTASAGVHYCDNDRAASQYPNCNNTLQSGWSYRTGTGADWNGDSRLSNAGVTTSYFWNFFGLSSGNSIGVRVWLANAAFTDPAAIYFMDFGGGLVASHGLNQNTAPSGWSNLGPLPFWVSNPRLSVKASGRSGVRTGADIVELTTFFGLVGDATREAGIVDAASCGVTLPGDQILAIQQRMLNSVDSYRDVKGSYQIRFQNNDQDDLVKFEVSETSPGSHVIVTRRSGEVSETRFDGRTRAITDASGLTVQTAAFAGPAPTGPRQYYNDACEPVFVRRFDPAAADAASDVLLPQNYAFWLSDSGARITGGDVVAGRKATVIAGNHVPQLAAKLGATSFQMWVDDATGTLLKLIGSDDHGAMVYSIAVDRIEFDRGVDRSHFTR